MKKYFALILGSFLVLCGLPTFAGAQFNRGPNRGNDRNERVCVYRDNNFTGREQCFSPGDEVSDLKSSQISSIRIYGRAHVIIYENTNFSGNSAEFTSDVPDLERRSLSGSRTWNDRVGSMRVISDDQGYNSGGRGLGRNDQRPGRDDQNYGRGQDVRDSVCVYENPNYQGRSQCWSARTSMPDLANWSDRISSIRIFGTTRVVLYRDAQFRGERVTIDRDIPNLSRLPMRGAGNWNDQISSFQVQEERLSDSRRR